VVNCFFFFFLFIYFDFKQSQKIGESAPYVTEVFMTTCTIFHIKYKTNPTVQTFVFFLFVFSEEQKKKNQKIIHEDVLKKVFLTVQKKKNKINVNKLIQRT